jgi:hypothetical protein
MPGPPAQPHPAVTFSSPLPPDPAPSPSESGPGTRLSPSAASRLSRPRTPRLAGRVTAADRWVRNQAALPQPSRSCFQTHWFLNVLLKHRHETVPEPFSYLARRFLHARHRRRHHRCHRRSTCPVNGHCHRGWTSDLYSSQLRPELGEALWRWKPAYAPGDSQTSRVYSNNPVLHLYISCFVTVNKPVLLYLLLRLLPKSKDNYCF